MIPQSVHTGPPGAPHGGALMQSQASDHTVTDDAAIGSLFRSSKDDVQRVVHRKRAIARNIYPVIMLVTDVLLIAAIFVIADSIRHDTGIIHAISRRILLVIEMMSVLGIALIGGYSYQTNTHKFRFVSEHVIVSVAVFIGVFFVIYSFVGYGFRMYSARSVVATTLIAFPLLSIVYRFLLGKIKASYQRGNALCIIGPGWTAADLYRRLQERDSTHKVMVFDPIGDQVGKHLISDDPDSPIVRPMDEMRFDSSMDGRYVENYVVARPLHQLPEDLVKRLSIAQFHGNDVCSYEAYLKHKMMMISPTEVNMGWALKGGFLSHNNPTYERIKRGGDVMFGLVGLIVFGPLMLLTAMAVKLTSRGPVIFKQERVGRWEVPFMLYKFRTMKVGSEEGPKYTAKNDSRLTPVGKLLRKTRMDELPQFWNVLKGDLSLVGPRAEWTELVVGYEQKFPYYHFRHAVKPGITGWAQVNYSYGASDKDTLEKLYYDLYYVREHSTMLDAIVLVKTVYVVLFGRGQ